MSWLSDPKSVQRLFIAVWALLFVGGLIFSRTASPAAKQKWQTPMAVCGGLTFLGFATWIGGRSSFLFLALPVAAIVWLNSRTIRYCRRCGAMARNPYIYPLPKFCQKCGASLDESESAG